MNQLRRLAIGAAAILGVILLLPSASFATAHVASQSPCTGDGADFKITLGFDSGKLEPTAMPGVNSACVAGGNSIAFDASNLPSGMGWSVVFPEPTLGSSVLANGCTFGSGSGESSTCTVIPSPTAGDYYYTVILTKGTSRYTLDPRVIIGHGGKPGSVKHRKKPARPKAAAPSSKP